jgi:hypothetical protein
VALAAFNDLCMDGADPLVPARFWATALVMEASGAGVLADPHGNEFCAFTS